MRIAIVAAAIAGCSTSGVTVSYSGSEHPVAVSASELESHAGRLPPPGYRIIGVVTARCTLLDGASGLLSDACNESAMLERARIRAAEVGGHALLALDCGEREIERSTESLDGGGYRTSTRSEVSCQATVARRRAGVAPVAPQPIAGETLNVAGTPVVVRVDRAPRAPELPPVDEQSVGELDVFPPGYARLGEATAECTRGCARSTARRAIRRRAAKLGATAVAALGCELVGDRWRCRAALVGAALPEPADAGT